MKKKPKRGRWAGSLLTAVASLAGAAIAFHLYSTPLTGVTGTTGALIVLGACLAVALGGVFMAVLGHTAWRWLTLLGIFGTALAAFFLHGWWILLAMAVALAGVLLDALAESVASTGASA